MMTENEFYGMCDALEDSTNLTDGYYPTVEELKEKGVEEDVERYAPILLYFSSDPFTREKIDGYTTNEYKEMVQYCKELVGRIELTETA